MAGSREWIPHIVTLVIGALLGWYTAHMYYVLSANDLQSYSRSALTQSEEQTRRVETQYHNLEEQYGQLEEQYGNLNGLVQNAITRGVVSAQRNPRGQITSLQLPSPPQDLQVH